MKGPRSDTVRELVVIGYGQSVFGPDGGDHISTGSLRPTPKGRPERFRVKPHPQSMGVTNSGSEAPKFRTESVNTRLTGTRSVIQRTRTQRRTLLLLLSRVECLRSTSKSSCPCLLECCTELCTVRDSCTIEGRSSSSEYLGRSRRRRSSLGRVRLRRHRRHQSSERPGSRLARWTDLRGGVKRGVRRKEDE